MIDASFLPRKNYQFVLSLPEESIILKMESGSMTTSLFKGKLNGSKSLRFATMDIEKLVTLNRKSEPCLEKPYEEEDNFQKLVCSCFHDIFYSDTILHLPRCVWRYYNKKYSCVLGGIFYHGKENVEKPCSLNTTMHVTNEMLRTLAKSSKEVCKL